MNTDDILTPPCRKCERLIKDAVLLDIMANTGCTYDAALAVVAVWNERRLNDEERAYTHGKKRGTVKAGSYALDGTFIKLVTIK